MTPSVKVNALSDWDDTLSLTLDIETNRGPKPWQYSALFEWLTVKLFSGII